MSWAELLQGLGWAAVGAGLYALLHGVAGARDKGAKLACTAHAVLLDGTDDEMLVTLSDGRKFRGSCTVWHHYPSGERASTSDEARLADIWERAKWARERDR